MSSRSPRFFRDRISVPCPATLKKSSMPLAFASWMPSGRRSRGKVPSETLTMTNWPGRAPRPSSGASIAKWK